MLGQPTQAGALKFAHFKQSNAAETGQLEIPFDRTFDSDGISIRQKRKPTSDTTAAAIEADKGIARD